jgi:hypothetical protein
MSYTRIINNIKYLQLFNDNSFKSLSLEDNVYFTLRDIFLNITGMDFVMEANGFNNKISGGVSYEERNHGFQYTNELYDKIFVDRLYFWLKHIYKSDFDFEELDDKADDEEKESYNDMTRLIKFDDWWSQLEDLKRLILIRHHELK